ncbi:MAG: hypothetical protein LQ348_002374 [Seirophora lacunosa]|nr:MAG: hypothetical protein LQ348_002374 [Seirophora lacunosa]
MAREKNPDEELNAPEQRYSKQRAASSQDFDDHDEKRNESRKQSVANIKLQNPLADMTYDELMDDVSQFADQYDMQYALDDLQKGALIAQKRSGFEKMDRLTDEDKTRIREEKLHRWRQPRMMYYMTILCAGSAIVQGMDQSAVNGAQAFYFPYFGIAEDQVWLRGLINGAPYLCSAVIGCNEKSTRLKRGHMLIPMVLQYYFGRRGCIFISCFISIAASIWMAVVGEWWNLLLARFALGFAVGAKSSTTPVYAAECAPPEIRGALAMMWQMWTAFGIMLGFIAGVIFSGVRIPAGVEDTQWRIILGSTAIPPMFVCAQVYLVPESPRWYMSKGKYDKAFASLQRFRWSRFQAARDLYYIHKQIAIEYEMQKGKNLWKEFFAVPRNRRAAQSSFFVMFMQQYSTVIFQDSGFNRNNALLVSMGTGIVNWLFAIPAVYTIDTFGRRNLLLVTFPLMAIMLLITGFSFLAPEGMGRLAGVATGIYMFMVVYSPGEGPVPFTYSAEAFPLYIREYGMAFATATTWGFNFILSLTWPALEEAFTTTGAFGWYAGWNFFGWVFAYFCLPETKERTLEELDTVFSMRTRDHARYYLNSLPWYLRKYILRGDVEPREPFVPSKAKSQLACLMAKLDELESELLEINGNSERLQRSHSELMELQLVLEKAGGFFDDAQHRASAAQFESGPPSPADSSSGTMEAPLLAGESTTDPKTVRLGFVAGVIQQEKLIPFERLLFRATRGNMFLKSTAVGSVLDPTSGEKQEKAVFVVFFAGERARTKILKYFVKHICTLQICEAFGANRYPFPEEPARQRQMNAEVTARLRELHTTIEAAVNLEGWTVQTKQETAIYHTLNKLSVDTSRKVGQLHYCSVLVAEAWCPVSGKQQVQDALSEAAQRANSSIIRTVWLCVQVSTIFQPLVTYEAPPTYHQTNKVTHSFQEIVDAYGVAKYREANPAPFTIVTFPFLFAVMFGDFGHGLLLLAFALWMVLREKIMGRQQLDEILGMCFGGANLVLSWPVAALRIF